MDRTIGIAATLALAIIAVGCGGSKSADGCVKDDECKGDRVCSDGKCIDPVDDKAGEATPQASAKADGDSLGETASDRNETAASHSKDKAATASDPAQFEPKDRLESPFSDFSDEGSIAAGGDSCDGLSAKICAVCGTSAPACAGWTEVLANPALRANMTGVCGQMGSTIDQIAAVPQGKEGFCSSNPMGAVANMASGEPATSCVELVSALCNLCGKTAAACTSFSKLAETPGALAAMPQSSCDMIVEQLPLLGQIQSTKDMFCTTDFLEAAGAMLGGGTSP